jgi:phage baseplate assembly protein V
VRQVLADQALRVAMLLVRGYVALVDDTKKMQQVQVRLLSNETKDAIEHFQPYGYTSVPLAGAEALVGCLGGNRTHAIAIVADDRRYRLTGLQGGEVALYTDEGTTVVLKRGKIVEVSCDQFNLSCQKLTIDASDSIKVTSPSVDVNES